VDPKANLDVVESLSRESNRDHPFRSESLYWLSCPVLHTRMRVNLVQTLGPVCMFEDPINDLFVDTVPGRIQKFPDWLPGTRTANGRALCQ
jgi:hypothetical protein